MRANIYGSPRILTPVGGLYDPPKRFCSEFYLEVTVFVCGRKGSQSVTCIFAICSTIPMVIAVSDATMFRIRISKWSASKWLDGMHWSIPMGNHSYPRSASLPRDLIKPEMSCSFYIGTNVRCSKSEETSMIKCPHANTA